MTLELFKLETNELGVTVVTFDRPPVNAVSYQVYHEMIELANVIEASDETRVVVFTGAPHCRAWIGGADLHDFLKLDHDSRLERYALVNEATGRFYDLDRPVIAAINKHAVGVGMAIAALCDIRVASNEAFFACPEIDRGLVTAGAAPWMRVNFPAGKIREMIYTAQRFMAEDLRDTGYFNYIVPPDQVMPKAMEIATTIAKKSLPALKANKICNNAAESLPWADAYKMTQDYSANLTAGTDSKEGIRAFLEKRQPAYRDK